MKINILNTTLLLLLLNVSLFGQVKSGRILSENGTILESVLIQSLPSGAISYSSATGYFSHPIPKQDSLLIFRLIGYAPFEIKASKLDKGAIIQLQVARTQLREITIHTQRKGNEHLLSVLDIQNRGIQNSQEILRLVPGLFIGQHQGGGKAEQIFVRGFDCDHGTDVLVEVDGMPVNLVSHAHGQGYADMHFVIPELVEQVDFRKGPYETSKGNFSTSGSVSLQTKSYLDENQIKLEAGNFGTFRAIALVNLLPQKIQQTHSLILGAEYAYSDGYFEFPQLFNRKNLQLNYQFRGKKGSLLRVSFSHFSSSWKASGQIPDRAVANGSIGFFGSIDPTEQGSTGRDNFNLQHIKPIGEQGSLKNQLFINRYDFDLVSNFTFFLEDTANGDQIRQIEKRILSGYKGVYSDQLNLGKIRLNQELGWGFRNDQVDPLQLNHTRAVNTILDSKADGNVNESNLFAYLAERFSLGKDWDVMTGIRFDRFINSYQDNLQNQKLKDGAGIWSPKLQITYHGIKQSQLFFKAGKGFHSNDTRVAVLEKGRKVLPDAWGADLGCNTKLSPELFLHGAIWYLWLDQEFVYSGDGGYAEPSGKTKRLGFDLSLRYQPFSWLYADIDLNYAKARMADELEGQNFIPLAPIWSSTGGINFKPKKEFQIGLRYRWLGDRAGNEDYSLTAKGYMVWDANMNYRIKQWAISMQLQNIFDTRWKETQFDTESKLKNETIPVSEIHFTAGTPFAFRFGTSYYF